jgi:hypothetical protein
MQRAVIVLCIVLAAARVAVAQDERAQLTIERGEPHVGVPFTLALVVEGFDETPEPEVPKLEIAGARVTPLGAQPSVEQSIQIINGRRSEHRRVRWIFRWSVEMTKPGRVRIGPVTALQGSKRVVASAGEVDVATVPTTDDMKLELQWPERAVYVGETIEAKVLWYFTREPESPQFSIPLASSEHFTISAAPATDPRRTLALQAGTKELPVPYEVDQVDVGGRRMHRVTMRLYAAPKQSGTIQLPAASVVGAFPVGRADFFGRAPTKLFRAADVPRTVEVKPLPETDKPASFAGAVGTQFSLQIGTSRSVVQLGEPVELAITVKSNQRLDMLSLGRLDGPGGLPKDTFTVPAEAPTGELSDDGKTKKFVVTAQVVGPATEIPAIAFSYFDPAKGRYQTIHSDPIALSVKGGSIVGAGDVIGVAPKKSGTAPQSADHADLALVGAELALSSPGAVDARPLGGMWLWLLVAALYLVPLLALALRTWQLRTQGQREEAAEVRAARRRVEAELARSAKQPARDTAGALVAALRALARTLERDPDDDSGVFAEIETESFAPYSAASPMRAELRERASDLVRRWTAEAIRKRGVAGKATTAVALVLALCVPTRDVSAATPSREIAAQALADGRSAYQEAMSVTDASVRRAAFARAASSLRQAAASFPDRPELLTDWGNAALGAGDVASATLAYRRALAIDGSTTRARKNLAWLRSRQPDAVRPPAASATDALLFFHHWPRPRRLLAGAGAFAVTVLLFVPWGGRRRRSLGGLAVMPAIVWLAMVGSLVLEDRRADDAVLLESVTLRAADSAGAPAALATPLSRGAEVTVLEHRDGWVKIQIASGTTGWVSAGAIERVMY